MDAEQLISLGKSLEESKKIKSEIRESKLEKARLDKNIVILKRANAEEQSTYNADSAKRKRDKAKIEADIAELETKRATLASSTIPELKKLNALKEEVTGKQAKLDAETEASSAKDERLTKEASKIKEKKEVLVQIGDLTKKL